MINKLNSTAFKINTPFLNYILDNWEKHNLLLDPTTKHKYADLEKMTRYQKSVYDSYNSKVVLQESILGIAQFFSKFPEIYFPVRLDQRGRLYCTPNFLNYQSKELSKALLLFANPGVINKNNYKSIAYLKIYGANCFGGKVSKMTIKARIDWVDNNTKSIIEYDNGDLLSKAKDKLLFLSFCMEYKHYYEFYIDENLMEFHTYLPIQLDATCNGFKHMALLSNEDTLFKELNLQAKGKNSEPGDFYNFLLLKLVSLFESKVNECESETIDKKTNASYERLNNFIWDRAIVKKAIMTIPYNSSARSMKKYITDSLFKVDYEEEEEDEYEENKSYWYSSSEKLSKPFINDKDIWLLISTLKCIIEKDFVKIRNLIKYLKNIANLFNTLELPISWALPTGLTITQSYLESRSSSRTPFRYSKVKLNLKVSIKDKFDKNKQVRSLMPNLIHSLDSSSLSLLYEQFSKSYKNCQFFSVHDCFGTTCDKVFVLKTILASVYTDIYSSDPYLYKLDKFILDNLEYNTNYKVDRINRTVQLQDSTYTTHGVDWVTNKKVISSKIIKKIDSQHIVL